MSTNNANHSRPLAVLVYPDVTLMDAAGPPQVFATAHAVAGVPARLSVLSRDGGCVRTDAGVALESNSLRAVDTRDIDTLLVAGGDGVFDAARDPLLLDWIRARAPTVRRVGSTCMGAFLLAEAGLLERRRVATHWRWVATLGERFPSIEVDGDAIYIEDAGIWTSAGVSAGVDLALAMVERDFGHAVALEVARRLVIPLKRAGGQSQFSQALELQTADRDGAFDAVHAWIHANLHKDLGIERLAEVYGRSPRTFLRHYKAATGTTPARAVARMRVEAARALLEEHGAGITRIARRCGFDNVETMRRSFLRCLGVSPTEYRARFGAGRSTGAGPAESPRNQARAGTPRGDVTGAMAG